MQFRQKSGRITAKQTRQELKIRELQQKCSKNATQTTNTRTKMNEK